MPTNSAPTAVPKAFGLVLNDHVPYEQDAAQFRVDQDILRSDHHFRIDGAEVEPESESERLVAIEFPNGPGRAA